MVAKTWETGMRLYEGEPWPATGHISGEASSCDHEVPRAQITLRRIGWLDQKGFVWASAKDWQEAGGPNGSITPLLINPGCD